MNLFNKKKLKTFGNTAFYFSFLNIFESFKSKIKIKTEKNKNLRRVVNIMVERDLIVSIEKPKIISKFDKESADSYQRSKYYIIPLLENFVIDPFEDGLKKKTGFNDFNPPKEETQTDITIDRIKFTIITSPSTKRPQYALVYDDIKNYVEYLITEQQRLKRIKDITNINNEPFISLNLLIEKIKNSIENAKVGKEGIKQRIVYDEDKIPKDIKDVTGFALNISRITTPDIDGSARIYVMAKKINEEYHENIKRFEELIKVRTGYSKENIPDERKEVIITEIPDYLFLVKIIPNVTPSFAKIINNLIYETPTGKITEKTGILIKAQKGVNDPIIEEIMVEKDKKKYVSLPRFSEYLNRIKEENTEKTIRFEIQALHDPA